MGGKTRKCGACKGTGTLKPAPSGGDWFPIRDSVRPCERCGGRGVRS